MEGFLRGVVGYCIVNITESKKLASNSCAHLISLRCGIQKVWFLTKRGDGRKKKKKKKSGKCQVPGVEQGTVEVLLHTVDSSFEDIREWRPQP